MDNITFKALMINSVVVGGLGIVGKATMKMLGIDDYFDLRGSNITLKEVAEQKRYIFMCLPTPTKNGDQYGVEEMGAIIKQVLDLGGGQKVFIIRSTVLPGTIKRLIDICQTTAIIHNPEFLTTATWEDDAEHPDLIVIGGEDNVFIEDVESLYKARFRGSVDIIKTDSKTSEIIKYAINTFYATKVVFANRIFDLCQRENANYEAVREAMYRRKWIGKNHLRIFDDKNGRGAGGMCLCKDLDAFANFSNDELLRLVNKINKKYLGEI